MNLNINAPHPEGENWEEYQRRQLEEFENHMINAEGDYYDYPYLDTVGKRTVCRGKNVNNPSIFYAQPWQIAGENRPATREEMEIGYNNFNNRPYGSNHGANTFENTTNLRLPVDYCEDTYEDDLNYFYNDLQEKMPNFSRMPLPAQLSILEPHYNTGTLTDSEKWPNLHTAASNLSQEGICRNIHRNPYDRNGNLITNLPSRNTWAESKCREETF